MVVRCAPECRGRVPVAWESWDSERIGVQGRARDARFARPLSRYTEHASNAASSPDQINKYIPHVPDQRIGG